MIDLKKYTVKPERKRLFIPEDYSIDSWESLKPYFEYLLNQNPDSKEAMEKYLLEVNEIDAVVDEEAAWRYIRMTCDTQNEEHSGRYQVFVQEILPHISIYSDKLNRKIVENPFVNELDSEYYKTYFRSLKNEIELFREENVTLAAEEQSIAQEYSALTGKLTIEHDGKTITLQQAGKYLESHDRTVRETVWRKVAECRKQTWDEVNNIFEKMLVLRAKIAENCGFSSYTDYKYAALERFDYSRKDCAEFHESVEKVIKPLLLSFASERKELLGLKHLRPWDMSVDIFGDTPLKPFQDGNELVEKSVQILEKLNPALGKMIALMAQNGYMDVESRIGKAPGGYNYPLAESGIPFIFMNAAGSQSDITTMLHESGHAVHSFVTRDIPLNALKNTPSEVAEVASMTMELLTLDYYDVFYADEKDRIRAQKEQIMRALTVFPWVAAIDAFQHWVYDNPSHTCEERLNEWTKIYYRFHGTEIDWSGFEENVAQMWTRQLHIFELPFYYIEYAFAQLGAIAIWRNYKENPEKALGQYLEALHLGYTKTIPEIYNAAGVSFHFSADYVRELADFCQKEYEKLK
ncbi:MAG: M3 family oligoendopeptidase [Bacteroidia bacterium]|nr:M3 family oligoendopeptidase [Bacteroidia bacterium]